MIFKAALIGGLFIATSAHANELPNKFVQENFTANKKSYKPQIREKDFVNAWGIAIRPAGAGGHFWVTAKDVSYQYVGDVQGSKDEKLQKLHADDLKYVKLPVGGKDNFATGVAFNGGDEFVITQKGAAGKNITGPAKFLFASDGGIISAWTEHKNDDGSFDRADDALAVIDESANGAQFFGVALNADYDKIYAADFGKKPTLRVYDEEFKPLNISFEQPFDENKNGQVDAGEYAPFNVQTLKKPNGDESVFVAYAKTQSCPKAEIAKKTCAKGEVFAGEEDTSKPGYGRVAEFDEDGNLLKVWNDGGYLNAPWGVAFAPANFGKLSNALLVSNFGDGTIAAYDANTHEFIDYMRAKNGKPVMIDKIWGILFGNGQSLGDANALYFAAGPKDETDGLFGSLRPAF